jgi:acyl carrier protein
MDAEPTPPALSFEEFRSLIALELGVPEELVAPKACFLDDLQADSLQLFDLFKQFAEKGVTIPLDAAWRIRTVQDAYEVYMQSAHNEQRAGAG